jgi:Ca2+-transporting ATPase
VDQPQKPWHQLPSPELAALLRTDPERGIESTDLAERRARYGPNALTARKPQSGFILFLLQLHQPLVYILIAAGVVTAVLQEWVDSGVIFGVVVVNAMIGYVQEAKARRAIDALARTLTSEATVIRDGERRRIAATELVPGDLVLLQSGDRVPADLRLVRARELRIDESSLTGESVPAEKKTKELAADVSLADRTNMAYSSTLVAHGTAAGVVVATGDETEIGRIHELISTADVLATPLTRKVTTFSAILLYVILGLGAATFGVGIARGEGLFEMFMAAVALAVGAIPEGLPAAVTITLAIGVGKMARRNAIIRRLPAVETLGSTTVICSDKTGTLTQNQMTVQEVVAGGEHFAIAGTGYVPEGAISLDGTHVEPAHRPVLHELLVAGLLCNEASLVKRGNDWQVEGDPTEGALIVSAAKAGLDREVVEREHPRLDAIPFESEHQYMATLHGKQDGKPGVIYLKGSVESVLARCYASLDPRGREVPLDAAAVHAAADELARRGRRVLAVARGCHEEGATHLEHADVESGLVFLGLQAMIDPPRAEALNAVRACQSAGIRVKMITGDHALTAVAIATELGLEGRVDENGELVALTGRDIAALSDAELIEQAHRTAVFARVAPEQKLRLVKALQSAEGAMHVVAMTGDGVNDAPALRRADIGVAMGITGTEVAKEAADMVLADDNFSSIEAAVEEGRGVYDNLVKFITWTLPTNIGEGLVILVAVFAGLRLPMLPVQILWINMTTAVLLGLMLAFEPKEPGIMQRPPRDPRSPILTKPLVGRILLVGVLLLIGSFGMFEWALTQGRDLPTARTLAVNVFVVGELFYLFNCRSLRYSMFRLGVFSNRWVLGGVTLTILLQLAFTYVPFMNTAFSSAPITALDWALITAIGFAIYVIVGVEKWLQNHVRGRTPTPPAEPEPALAA